MSPTVTAAEPVAAPHALPGETDYHALNAMLNLYDNDGNPILGFDLREEKLTDGSTVLNLYLKADR